MMPLDKTAVAADERLFRFYGAETGLWRVTHTDIRLMRD